MERVDISGLRVGILGGGQLGRMFILAATSWEVRTYVLAPDPDCPAAEVCTALTVGDCRDAAAVAAFGRDKDVVTIEIEEVSADGLAALEACGVAVRPQSDALRTIQDKGLQKEFFRARALPSPRFELFDDARSVRDAVASGELALPFVQKLRRAGYDGRGVEIARERTDLGRLLDAPSVVESLIDIAKEISVIVSRNRAGEVSSYPVVEMLFHPEAHLVDTLLCPARLEPATERDARELAVAVVEALGLEGLLAVEMFLARDGKLYINEIAPRPHNSGHHTIESVFTSQYEQHLRAICALPPGSTELKVPAVMVNLLGAAGRSGPVRYEGLRDCLAVPGAKVHLYGKQETRPFRKMGHVTILDHDIDRALEKATYIRKKLKVTA